MKSRKAVLKMPPADASSQSLAPLVEELLKGLGEDPGREGLQQTPQRVEKALRFLTSGYRADIRKIVNGALFEVKYDEMVIVKDIEFFSMCEHHMLPFFGKMHVAYLPKRPGHRAKQNSAHRGCVRAAAADSGAAHAAGGGDHPADHRPDRRGRDLRSAPLLHDDARSGKTAFRRGHQRHAGGISQPQGNAGRISIPGAAAHGVVSIVVARALLPAASRLIGTRLPARPRHA